MIALESRSNLSRNDKSMTTIVYGKEATQPKPRVTEWADEVMRLRIRVMGKLAAIREEHDEDVWELWGALEDQPVRCRAEAAEYDARGRTPEAPCHAVDRALEELVEGALGDDICDRGALH
jgi:hypothetical protein